MNIKRKNEVLKRNKELALAINDKETQELFVNKFPEYQKKVDLMLAEKDPAKREQMREALFADMGSLNKDAVQMIKIGIKQGLPGDKLLDQLFAQGANGDSELNV